MLKILSQPYPYPEESLLRRFLQCLGEGLFIALFLIIFQPFGVLVWEHPNKNLLLLGYGLITMVSGMLVRVLLPNMFPKYFTELPWTIGREISIIFILLALIATGNGVYSTVVFGVPWHYSTFLWSFVGVLLLGFFPVVFGIMINYIHKLKKYSQPIVLPTQSSAISIIKLIAENERDILEIASDEFLFIESSDNYATVHFLKNDLLRKELIRSSLGRLETQISNNNIVRCHRSFIVNLTKVERISGNAQGYKFHLNLENFTVPVARKYSKLVEKLR